MPRRPSSSSPIPMSRDVEVGLAGRDDADAVVGGAGHDPVQPVEARVLLGAGLADGELVLFELHQFGAQQAPAGDVRAVAERAEVGDDAVGGHLRGRGAVGDVGRDLQRRPQPGDAGHQRGVHAEVEDVLRVGRIEHGHVQVGQGHLRRARDRRALGARVVADERDRAAAVVGADEVRVPQRVGRAVETRGLAVPVADDPVAGRAVGGRGEGGDARRDL